MGLFVLSTSLSVALAVREIPLLGKPSFPQTVSKIGHRRLHVAYLTHDSMRSLCTCRCQMVLEDFQSTVMCKCIFVRYVVTATEKLFLSKMQVLDWPSFLPNLVHVRLARLYTVLHKFGRTGFFPKRGNLPDC